MENRSCHEAHIFVEPAVHDILCCGCGKVARDAVRSRACQHVYGMHCILEHLVRHEACPKCFVSLDCTMLEPSEALRQYVSRATVRCPLGPQVCEWTGPLSQMQEHLHSENCGVPKINCPFCQQSFDAAVFDAHKQECPNALVLCPNCNDAIERSAISEHLEYCNPPPPKTEKPKNARGSAYGRSTAGAGSSNNNMNDRRRSSVRGDAPSGPMNRSMSQRNMPPLGRDEQQSGGSTAKRRSQSAAPKLNESIRVKAIMDSPASSSNAANSQNRNTNMSQHNTSLTARPKTSGQSPSELSLRSPTRNLMNESLGVASSPQPSAAGGGGRGAGVQPMSTSVMMQAAAAAQQQQFAFAAAQQQQQQQHNTTTSGSNSTQHTVIIPPDFASISSLYQEMSKLGQRCNDLESQVTEMKKRDVEKDNVITVLTNQLKAVEENVHLLMAKVSDSVQIRPTAVSSKHSVVAPIGEPSAPLAPTNQARPTSPPEKASRNLAPIGGATSSSKAHPSSSSKHHQQQSSSADNKEPHYSTRNKQYKGSDLLKKQKPVEKNDAERGDAFYHLPSDVSKQVKSNAGANDISQLVKRETALRKQLDEGMQSMRKGSM